MKQKSKINIPLIAILCAACALFIFIFLRPVPKNTTYIPSQDSVRSLTIGDKTTISVEIADTPEETTLGLSYRPSLPENYGMLFAFPVSHIPTFWMKGMNFPLDMIWIDENNTIVDITENVPAPLAETPEYELPHYSPKVPAKMVLEVNAGFSETNGIEIGDSIKL